MKYIFFLSIASLSLFSCNKYLDKKSDNTLVVPSSIEDLQGLLDDADIMNAPVTPSMGEASTDDYFLQLSAYEELKDQFKHIYSWTPHDYYAINDWSSSYLPIYNTNYCLETINSIDITQNNATQWHNIKGSSLFFRAYHFLNLLWVYSKAYNKTTSNSDLGIVLRLTSDFNVPSVRASIEQSYNQVIRDTKESINHLPDLSQHLTRPSKCASYGLLARTYLTMGMYDSSLKYSNLCLSLKSTLLDYNDATVNVTSNIPFPPENPEIIFFTEMNEINSLHATNRALIDTQLISMYNSDDLRKSAFFRPRVGYHRFKGSYSSNSSRFFTGLATNEILLIRAESYIRTGNIDAALADINLLLRNRWSNTVTYPYFVTDNPDKAKEVILDERRKELLMRGIRWIDIKRLNNEGAEISLTRNINGQQPVLRPNDPKYALPLPTDIIAETGIPQNPF